MPNLIEVQRESYEQFLRSRPQDGMCPAGKDPALGLPDPRFRRHAELDFVNYELKSPNTTPTSAASAA
jgi:DNA-directed RNA polymerase subunit beta